MLAACRSMHHDIAHAQVFRSHSTQYHSLGQIAHDYCGFSLLLMKWPVSGQHIYSLS